MGHACTSITPGRLSWRGTVWCGVQVTDQDLYTLNSWGKHSVPQGLFWQCHLDLDLCVSQNRQAGTEMLYPFCLIKHDQMMWCRVMAFHSCDHPTLFPREQTQHGEGDVKQDFSQEKFLWTSYRNNSKQVVPLPGSLLPSLSFCCVWSTCLCSGTAGGWAFLWLTYSGLPDTLLSVCSCPVFESKIQSCFQSNSTVIEKWERNESR